MLIYPASLPVEGPRAFRLRTLHANLVPGTQSALLDGDCLFRDVEVDQVVAEDWIGRTCRWCSNCLRETEIDYGRVGWEVRFADACARCGCWLIDRCGRCGEQVLWSRDSYGYCKCGARLHDHPARQAPPSLVRMSRALEARACRSECGDLPLLNSLTLHQCTQLIRWLGTYGALTPQRMRQKIPFSETIEATWPVTTLAAEVLVDWPNGFDRLLDQLRRNTGPDDHGSLARTLRGFYRSLYVAFRAPEFDWLRAAFEEYVAAHWSGSMARRNRRVYAGAGDRMAWIPMPEAARRVGISSAAMRKLADEGHVESRTYETASGRRFSAVSQASLGRLIQSGALTTLTLESVAKELGLKRSRLRELLPVICPEASKLPGSHIWRLPEHWVEEIQVAVNRLPTSSDSMAGEWLSIDWLLRYNGPSSRAMGQLINAVVKGDIDAVRDGRSKTLTAVRCNPIAVEKLWAVEVRPQSTYVTVMDAAERLNMKQEVAYALIRAGVISAEVRKVRRRASMWVNMDELVRFVATYVSAREWATHLRTSPSALTRSLAELGVAPVAGPTVNGCRQVIYRRQDVERLGLSLARRQMTGFQ